MIRSRPHLPPVGEFDVAATGRLLIIRAKRFEFGRTDFGNGLPVFDVHRGWKIGDGARVGGPDYFLSHHRAALVAIGAYSIVDVPATNDIDLSTFRFPRMNEEAAPLVERKPVQSETTGRVRSAAK